MRTRLLTLGILLLLGFVSAFAESPASAGSLSQVFKRVNGALVVVRTSGRVASAQSGGKAVSIAGLGSGVLVSADGKVVTAAHVVQTADAVAVEFPGDVLVRAEIVASDPATDVALLQLERVPPGVTPVKLGDSDKAEVGDQVFVVGAPLGITHTLTVGHLSGRRQPSTDSIVMAELFQTDAAINQGNPGGPMFNMNGEVIGVVSHIISRSGGSEGLGFVVTSNMARRLLFEEPTVWSGLEGYLLTGEMARAFNLPAQRSGLLVQRVAEGSPAEQLGVRGGNLPAMIGEERLLLGGDIILAVEDVALGAPGSYESSRRRLMDARAAGGSIRLTVLRGGETIELRGAVKP